MQPQQLINSAAGLRSRMLSMYICYDQQTWRMTTESNNGKCCAVLQGAHWLAVKNVIHRPMPPTASMPYNGRVKAVVVLCCRMHTLAAEVCSRNDCSIWLEQRLKALSDREQVRCCGWAQQQIKPATNRLDLMTTFHQVQ